MTYAAVGVDRDSRERLRKSVVDRIYSTFRNKDSAFPLRLPFGLVFASSQDAAVFVDFQIEGVGTKTILAELEPRAYSTIGIDAVAMAANDVIRSGSRPMFVADAIHIANSRRKLVERIISGVIKGAEQCGATLVSGETGDVPEILHQRIGPNSTEPFDLFATCIGFTDRDHLIMGGIEEGDQILGIESSGIHSNGVTLARRVLLRKWGGKYDPQDQPEGLSKPLIKELLEPTRIYARQINQVSDRVRIKAAIHITGDGFAKFRRVADFNASIPNSPSKGKRLGFDFDLPGETKPIFSLLYDTAKNGEHPITLKEMYQTFNMGYGFSIIVDDADSEEALDLLNKYYPSRRVGQVTSNGRIRITGPKQSDSPIII